MLKSKKLANEPINHDDTDITHFVSLYAIFLCLFISQVGPGPVVKRLV